MKPINAKFLCNNIRLENTNARNAREYIQINQNWLYLKHWYDMYGHGKINWGIPDIVLFDDTNEIDYVDAIITTKVDVVGFSIFAWNAAFQFKIAKILKEKAPEILIIFGGPHLTAHKSDDAFTINSDFFKQHPYIDYVVYGDGERALQQILDYNFYNIGNKSDFVNIVENCNGNRIIYPYERLTDSAYWESDPFRPNKKYIQTVIDQLISIGIDKKDQQWVVEFTRGCMYSCSFCDWSQNLTKKVKRRQSSWKDTIDFWIELDVPVRDADANFGMWKEDILLFDYALSKYDPTKNFMLIIKNTPKLNLKASEYIKSRSISTYGEKLTSTVKMFSIQDIHNDVLDAIDRPAIPWQEVKLTIKNFKKESPKTSISGEIIYGLPNQTLDHVTQNLAEFFILNVDSDPKSDNGFYKLTFLPNAPMADENYRKKWGLEFRDEYYLIKTKEYIEFTDIEDIFKNLNSDKNFYTVPTIYKTNTMSRIDIMACYFLKTEIDTYDKLLTNIFKRYGEEKVKEVICNDIKERAINQAKSVTRLDLEDKYGISVAASIKNNRLYRL